MLMPLTIKIKVVKVGNSLRMTIPKPVVEALGIKEGGTLEVGLTDHSMIVKKASGE
jgi:putative addiction module antidote